MMKIAIIVPYFGKLPNYFPLFLESCRHNPEYDWFLLTDDRSTFSYPSNVHRQIMDFDQCRRHIQARFDFPLALDTPQKLCDFKCAYGFLFAELLQGYDWWGHCDLDQIFGCLKDFITEDMLQRYDKLFSLGHLTLYRNTGVNNLVFRTPLNGKERFREVFTTPVGCGFDEWLPENINDIYLQSGRPVHLGSVGADINPYKTVLTTVEYDLQARAYRHSPIDHSIFEWRGGKLCQLYWENGALRRRAWAYIHLQKRPMTDDRTAGKPGGYYILPNRFVDGDLDPMRLLLGSRKWKLLNHQWVRVKWNSLKRRIRSGDWTPHNVFAQKGK